MATGNVLKLKFITETGKSFTLSVSDAAPALIEEGGEAAVEALVTHILAKQPFSVTLSSLESAKYVQTTETDIPVSPSA